MVQRLGERHDSELRHVVRGDVRCRLESCARGGVDDVALAGVSDEGKEGLHAVDDAPEVDPQDPLPVLQRQLLEAARPDDARVVVHDVDLSERVQRRLRQRLDVFPPADVRRQAEHVVPVALEPGDGRLQRIALDVRQHHTHSLLREPGCGGQADSAGRAGHDGHPALELVHCPLLRSSPATRC